MKNVLELLVSNPFLGITLHSRCQAPRSCTALRALPCERERVLARTTAEISAETGDHQGLLLTSGNVLNKSQNKMAASEAAVGFWNQRGLLTSWQACPKTNVYRERVDEGNSSYSASAEMISSLKI